jgi:hypothetical protein
MLNNRTSKDPTLKNKSRKYVDQLATQESQSSKRNLPLKLAPGEEDEASKATPLIVT